MTVTIVNYHLTSRYPLLVAGSHYRLSNTTLTAESAGIVPTAPTPNPPRRRRHLSDADARADSDTYPDATAGSDAITSSDTHAGSDTDARSHANSLSHAFAVVQSKPSGGEPADLYLRSGKNDSQQRKVPVITRNYFR